MKKYLSLLMILVVSVVFTFGCQTPPKDDCDQASVELVLQKKKGKKKTKKIDDC